METLGVPIAMPNSFYLGNVSETPKLGNGRMVALAGFISPFV